MLVMHIVQSKKVVKNVAHAKYTPSMQVKLTPKKRLKQISKQHAIYPWQAKFSSNSHDKQILPQNTKRFKHCRACILSISISTRSEKSSDLIKRVFTRKTSLGQTPVYVYSYKAKRKTQDSSEGAELFTEKSR
ncbi:hypothetical protein PRUPE_1G193200 [Prunus persica]|uniref:Uncharacterized protein n=1 Tax=Prunus persica TaxID=3760 RepID=A0A251QZR0_PRUPE|nr:hypothetical protein PRUPE_1G193200 [Prunus persica]